MCFKHCKVKSFGIHQLCWFPIHLLCLKILSEISCSHTTCVADLCLHFHNNTNGPGVHFWPAMILQCVLSAHEQDHLDTEPLHLVLEHLMTSLKAESTDSKAQPHWPELLHFLSIKPGQVTLTIVGGENFLQYSTCNKGAAVSHVCYVKNAGARHFTKVLPLIAWMSSRIKQKTPTPTSMHRRVSVWEEIKHPHVPIVD